MSSDTFVIVGARMAGGKGAETLREEGFDGRIVLVGAEPHRPYERPPLSKDYLRGESTSPAWLQERLEPRGIGVVLEAEHLCMSLRGVQKPGSRTVTSALHGLIRDDPRTRAEFLALSKETS